MARMFKKESKEFLVPGTFTASDIHKNVYSNFSFSNNYEE